MGVGMIVCGAVTDRLEPAPWPIRKWTTAIVYTADLAGLPRHRLLPAPGGAQLLLLAVGIFFAAGTTGPAGAMVANLTHESIRATAFGTLTLANNLLGLAAGPLVTGILADQFGLVDAMKIVPLAAVGALIALLHRPPGLPAQPRQGQRRSAARWQPDERRDRRPRPGPPGPRRGPLADAARRHAAERADRPAARPDQARACTARVDAAGPDRRRTSTARWSSSPTAPASWSTVHWAAQLQPDAGRRGAAGDAAGLRRRRCRRSTPRSAELRDHGWLPIPRRPLPFPSIVAASTDDPLGNPVRLRGLAARGGAGCIDLGAVGHLNPASGFGDWPEAVELIEQLRGGVRELAA